MVLKKYLNILYIYDQNKKSKSVKLDQILK